MYLNFTIDDQDKIIGEGVIQACQVGESLNYNVLYENLK